MSIKMKVIVPKQLLFEPKKLSRAIENALDGAAEAARVDFEVTQQTWKHKATFTIIKKAGERIVKTGDEPYVFVNRGTKPHLIRAKNAKTLSFQAHYTSKTSPRWIGSRQGGPSGPMMYTPVVHHPGTEPRDFDAEIAKKWQKELPIMMQRAIDSEVS